MCRARVNSVQGYFLAGRFMTWLPVGASLFASNIGSEHFIGLAGSGASQGIAVGAFEFNAAILLQLLGWVFLPVYISSGVYTLPDYMKKRFGGSRIRIYLTVLSLILYIFTKISVNLYSGSLFINEALGWNIWFSILFILSMTALITITGGLAAVLYTDLVQTFVMLFGAILLTGIGFSKIGGFPGLLERYGSAISAVNLSSTDGESLILNIESVAESNALVGIKPSVDSVASSPNISTSLTCALPSSKAFVMLRDVSDPEMPWLGYILGQTPASICLSHAQGATLMAGFIKLFPLFIIIIPGMISRILYPVIGYLFLPVTDTIGCGTAEECFKICGNHHGCSDWAYPKLVMGIMPDGLRGLMLSVMLAALMSDLTSIFNSSSTLFTVDIYTSFRRKAGNRELMIVGRLFVFVMVALSILWVPVIQSMQGGQLYIYIQSISGYLSPPIAAVYIMALMWKRNNELGAFTGLVYGFIIGVVRMILSFVYSDPICGEPDNRPWIVAKVHYMYFAMFSFFSTGLVMCLVSLISHPPTEEQIRGLTFWTRNEGLTPNKQLTFDDDDNGFGTTNGSVMREVRFGAEISLKDPEEEEEEMDSEKNGLPSKKFVVEELDTTIENTENGEESERDISAKSPDGSCLRCLHISRHVCQWFWGFSDDPCPSYVQCCCGKRTSKPPPSTDETLNFIPISLQQKRSVKIGLFIGLVFIVSITVFLFCFFSLYFGPITRGPLRLIGNSTSTAVLNAIKQLQDYNMIAS
ncbi:unnamed protein product [Hymenolepis diminuta]|uniref:Sodium/myo-inositol cotransporter n=1 Tax=Hymenolepis diminuta TaxID=6216 RepID=A0A158QE60_HYMDI|nr:unnamed protein product [Hymenolepis diminuta]